MHKDVAQQRSTTHVTQWRYAATSRNNVSQQRCTATLRNDVEIVTQHCIRLHNVTQQCAMRLDSYATLVNVTPCCALLHNVELCYTTLCNVLQHCTLLHNANNVRHHHKTWAIVSKICTFLQNIKQFYTTLHNATNSTV